MALRDEDFKRRLELAKGDPEIAKALWEETRKGLDGSLADMERHRRLPTFVLWGVLGLSLVVLAYAGYLYFQNPSDSGTRSTSLLLAGTSLISLTAASGLLIARRQGELMEEIASEIAQANRQDSSSQ